MGKAYDVCIVGSGISGALLACEATRRGLTVAVIEAGPRFDFSKRLEQLRRHEILGGPRWPWEHETRDLFMDVSEASIGVPYPLNENRIKAVGGSTLHWGGRINRLLPSDFRTASTYGVGVDWPLSYEDLEPYYSQVELEIGVSGTEHPLQPPRSRPYPMQGFPLGVDESIWQPVAEKLKMPIYPSANAINTRSYGGRSQCLAYAQCKQCPSGARYSADFHIAEAEATGRCDVFSETVARRIDIDGAGDVKAIHATTLVGKDLEFRAKRYLIAAHAVESARLLLLSKCANHSDQVGRNLMEHIYVSTGGYMPSRRFSPSRIGFDRLESLAFYEGPERQGRGAIKLDFSFEKDPLEDKQKFRIWGKALADYDCEKFGRWLEVEAETEQQPNPDSRVTLDPHVKDTFGDPAPNIRLAFSHLDRRTQARAKEIGYELIQACGVEAEIFQSDTSFAAHHLGTCRMSDDPNQGVVDRNCQVHGASNLFIAGGSVFPNGGALQPTATIAALSLRLAKHLFAPDG